MFSRGIGNLFEVFFKTEVLVQVRWLILDALLSFWAAPGNTSQRRFSQTLHQARWKQELWSFLSTLRSWRAARASTCARPNPLPFHIQNFEGSSQRLDQRLFGLLQSLQRPRFTLLICLHLQRVSWLRLLQRRGFFQFNPSWVKKT